MNYLAPKMKTDKDCGLTAMAWAINRLTYRDYDEIYNELKELMNYNDVDLDDNPSEHERIINMYGVDNDLKNIKFSLVEPIKENLFSGKCPNNATIILIKQPNEKTSFSIINDIISTATQHWIVLHSVDIENKMIDVWMGNGGLYRVSFEKMEKWITCGILPNCVYVIGDYKSIQTPWYSKLYMKIINTILKIFKR